MSQRRRQGGLAAGVAAIGLIAGCARAPAASDETTAGQAAHTRQTCELRRDGEAVEVSVQVPEGAELVQAPEGCRIRWPDGREEGIALRWVGDPDPERTGTGRDVIVTEIGSGDTRVQVGAFYSTQQADAREEAEDLVHQIQIVWP